MQPLLRQASLSGCQRFVNIGRFVRQQHFPNVSAKVANHKRVSPYATAAAMDHNELYGACLRMVPSLEGGASKGEAGKVAVIGGCREYTGAPYFSSISSLKVGADLAHVFCTQGAATVIKSYSPELIVHPYIPDSNDYPEEPDEAKKQEIIDKAVEATSHWLPRFDSLVLGPGLGRDSMVHAVVIEVMKSLRSQNKAMLIDADGLHIVTHNLDLVKGYENAILTPNHREFERLAEAVNVGEDGSIEGRVKAVAAALNGPTIVRKGKEDIITNGDMLIKNGVEGSSRRAGGQGDVLSGSTATFLSWALLHHKKSQEGTGTSPLPLPPHMLAAYAGATTMRHASRIAFAKYHRAMVAGNVIEMLGDTMYELFDSRK